MDITKDEFADKDGHTLRTLWRDILKTQSSLLLNVDSATKIELQNSPHYVNRGNILCAGTGEPW